MTENNSSSLTRRELLAAGAGVAAAAALLQPAAAQTVAPVPIMPTSSRELWQWVRTQPMLDLQTAYLDVASGGPTARGAEPRPGKCSRPLDRRNQPAGDALRGFFRLRTRRAAVHARRR